MGLHGFLGLRNLYWLTKAEVALLFGYLVGLCSAFELQLCPTHLGFIGFRLSDLESQV